MTDSNAWSPALHMPKENARGKKVQEFLTLNNLSVLNKGPLEENYTWKGRRADKNGVLQMSKTIVDLSIISPNLQYYAKDWKVADGAPSSDHRSIQFVIKLEGHEVIKKRNFNQAGKHSWTT